MPMDTVSSNLDENMAEMKHIFDGDKTLLCHPFQPLEVGGLRCCLYCIDGMVNSVIINENVIKPVALLQRRLPQQGNVLEFVEQQVLQACEIKKESAFDKLLHAVLYGDTLLFVDGCDQALIVGTKGFMKRGISEPASESYMKGPREGFVEPMLHNLAMLRRKLRCSDLKLEYFTLGKTTKTTCCLCYLDSAVDRQALSAMRKRMAKIDIDGVFDSNYIVELVRDDRHSPFRTTGSTERPDVVAAKLLEGRLAIFVDGSPIAITAPHITLEYFQSGEDYYVSYQFATFNRLLRIVGFLVAISVAPIYLALVTMQQELLPLPLLLSIAKARQEVPFSTFTEMVLLLTAFDMLREAGTRTPSNIGQTISVVGGLVIGQAAVDARLISVPVLIVVAVSGIAALIAPKLKSAVVLFRLALMGMAAVMGIYGYLLGMMGMLALMASQKSFGVDCLSSLPLERLGNAEDSYARPPFHVMKKYGRFLAGKGGRDT